jgi:hypothetical protein
VRWRAAFYFPVFNLGDAMLALAADRTCADRRGTAM